ncbi:MAG: hypothetical protein AB2688_12160 [Candidatus Thiodiazotropha taylori]|nr:hypothetical protein [Candidatus Thiodiazotropha taylori]MCG8051013.1 hypothetical protein [Candidatus Thiodiazotropha taylori]MCW4312832.1 hypothetical protein [Candidatus Thiodiazotropha taylori]MCW4320762.1 hypothetical protein [Candidatus Thiodiazotropha taylori]
MNKSQVNKLMKLNSIRIRRQEKKLSQAKMTYVESCEKVDRRNIQINLINSENKELLEYLSLQTTSKSPIKREYVKIRKFWLNYDLEMHEYYLVQENDEKNINHSEYQSEKKQWYKQKLKNEQLSLIRTKVLSRDNSNIENREDELCQESMNK